MKKIGIIMLLFCTVFCAQGQGVIGKWKTVDDQTGQTKSIVEIYEKSGKIYGKIIDLINKENRKNTCVNCIGIDKNKPIIGMEIIKGLTKNENEYSSGDILDPNNGKLYKCIITLEGTDQLKVRGYIGFLLLEEPNIGID